MCGGCVVWVWNLFILREFVEIVVVNMFIEIVVIWCCVGIGRCVESLVLEFVIYLIICGFLFKIWDVSVEEGSIGEKRDGIVRKR